MLALDRSVLAKFFPVRTDGPWGRVHALIVSNLFFHFLNFFLFCWKSNFGPVGIVIFGFDILNFSFD